MEANGSRTIGYPSDLMRGVIAAQNAVPKRTWQQYKPEWHTRPTADTGPNSRGTYSPRWVIARVPLPLRGKTGGVRLKYNHAKCAGGVRQARRITPMKQEYRRNKIITISLLFGAQFFSYMIRYALGVVAPALMALYHLSPQTLGYILSGWNWSYTAALPLAGLVVDRFGAWMVMGLGSLVWGISTLVLPLASTATSLLLLRLIFGFGHSMLIPAGASAILNGFSFKERTRAVAIAFAGNQVGLAICATVASFLLVRFGWQAVFYSIGSASLLFTLAWFGLYPDKRIGRRPSGRVGQASIRTPAEANPQRISWLSLLRYRSTWGIGFGQMGYLYAYFFFVSWLPGYFVLERKMTLLESGIAAALPFWAGMLGTLGGGWLGDYLIQRGVTTGVSRKSIIGIGLITSTVLVVIAAYVEQSWLAVTLLTLCVVSLRLTTGSVNSLPIDLAPPPAVASLTSIQNVFGSIGGLLAPIVTGRIVNVTGSFVISLLLAGAMALFAAISYLFIMGDLGKDSMMAPVARERTAPDP
jgi:MFS transporter, ACS family, D-galactonate transporter